MAGLTQKIIVKKITNLTVPDKNTGKNKLFFLILDKENNIFQYECVQEEDGLLDYTTQKLSLVDVGEELIVMIMKKRIGKSWTYKIIKLVEEESESDNIDKILNF